MILKDKLELHNNGSSSNLEWLETNGLGGWSSSTVSGAHSRRYHGLLMAAVVPPVERRLVLSSLDETIVAGGERFELGSHLYQSGVSHPGGEQYLDQFSRDLFPQWEYEAGGVRLRKTVLMLYGENTVILLYDILEAPGDFELEWRPLTGARGYHELQRESPALHWDVAFDNGIFHNRTDGTVDLYISIPGSNYHHHPQWYRKFEYSIEKYRGLDYHEDLLNHGVFSVKSKKDAQIGIIISTMPVEGRDALQLARQEMNRRQLLLGDFPGEDFRRQLTLAADQFIVNRGDKLKTIIAGYHWFTDWGRDTMISLPGLCLSTGRFEDARKILLAFAEVVDKGMLPNRFQDNQEPPEYNNVDGTLWYFIAIYKYWQATGDMEFIREHLLPVLQSILDWHIRGTRFNIKVQEDGLLYAGQAGQQLTWMDARIGDWVVTPRMGKPVEIQALWYNAQQIYAEFCHLNGQPEEQYRWNQSAEETRQSFLNQFWFAEGNYCYDVLDENGVSDSSFRPNQLFAISLPFSLIEGERARQILEQVTEKLFIPAGIRTLPAEDPRYISVYGGDQWHRDSSYHQGTAWSWLIGSYIDALAKTGSDKNKLQSVIDQCKTHLEEGCIGTISEIFDAVAPHHPRGCAAQAWGVAEWLRVVHKYQLS